MGIFEDVILNAKAVVGTVGKKAGEVVDISKLKLAAADLRSELSQKYQILGRITFEESKTGKKYEKSKNELIEKIAELKSQLESVTDMIERSRQKHKCPACGVYNARDAVFCSKCGEKLRDPKNDDEHMSPDDVIDFTEDNFADDDLL